jgi:hypothetical protein
MFSMMKRLTALTSRVCTQNLRVERLKACAEPPCAPASVSPRSALNTAESATIVSL